MLPILIPNLGKDMLLISGDQCSQRKNLNCIFTWK